MPDKNHPSYGMLSFSRCSIGGDGEALFGSSILHNDTIRLNISAGVLDRHGNETRYYPRNSAAEKYIEVEMSFSQFTEAITSLNMGGGVPVTVRMLNGQNMPPCPYEDKQKLMRQEFGRLAESVAGDIDSQTKEVAELLQNKKTLSKADRDFILSVLKGASAKIDDHMPFMNEMFAEQMDKTITEAKGEFESFLQNKLNRIAIEAIAEKQKQEIFQQYSGLLSHEETKGEPEKLQDSAETVEPFGELFPAVPKQLQTLKLYMPLTVRMYDKNEWGDTENEPVELDDRIALTYENHILAALLKERMPQEAERGLMEYYHEDDSVNRNVRSFVFTAEPVNGRLMGVAECRVQEELTAEELALLKEAVTSQASDGFGEGFEQREINTPDGEIYVSLWSSDKRWSIMTQEELEQGQQMGGMQFL